MRFPLHNIVGPVRNRSTVLFAYNHWREYAMIKHTRNANDETTIGYFSIDFLLLNNVIDQHFPFSL